MCLVVLQIWVLDLNLRAVMRGASSERCHVAAPQDSLKIDCMSCTCVWPEAAGTVEGG